MHTFVCVTAYNRYDRGLQSNSITWGSLRHRLTADEHIVRLPQKISEIDALSPAKKAEYKDKGWYLPGKLDPLERKKSNLEWRSILTLDVDHCEPWVDVTDFVDEACRSLGSQQFMLLGHTTFSDRQGKPRYRLLIPLLRPVKSETYEALTRYVMDLIGIRMFDCTTSQPCRIMYWPVVAKDQVFSCHETGKVLLDPEAFLSRIEGWRDWRNWPRHPDEPEARPPVSQVKPAWEKPGVVGAFCKAFSIDSAISFFKLPYEHAAGNRYRYTKGEGAPGAVYYETTGHLCSWHETDPAQGTNNAWDLVRIHRYVKEPEGGPVHERSSHVALVKWAMKQSDVMEHMQFAAKEEEFEEEEEEEEEGKEEELSLKNRIVKGPVSVSQRKEFITEIAASKMADADIEAFSALLRAKHEAPKPRTAAILKEIKQEKKRIVGKELSDLDETLVYSTLTRFFDGGRYIRRFGRQFWAYQGGVWLQREDELIKDKLYQTIIEMRDESNLNKTIRAYIEERGTSSLASGLWPMFCSRVAGLENNPDPMKLLEAFPTPVMNCRNYELHFYSHESSVRIEAHMPEKLRTSQLAVEYDKDADTSYWDTFCEHLFDGNSTQKRHLEEVCGYILQPWREIACIFLFKGAPSAGKTTIGRVLNSLLGLSAVNLDLSHFGNRDNHDTAALVGKLMLLDDDFAAGARLNDGFLRKISEAKQMTANPKHKNTFGFICRAVPVIFSNNWPVLREHSGAVERRAVVWDMPPFPEKARDEKKRIALFKEGLPGAFLRFVDGFGRLYRRGKWLIPEENQQAVNVWMEAADSVKMWAMERLKYKRGAKLSRASAYDDYITWNQREREGGKAVGKQEFGNRMIRMYGQPVKSYEICWKNIELIPEEIIGGEHHPPAF